LQTCDANLVIKSKYSSDEVSRTLYCLKAFSLLHSYSDPQYDIL